MKTLQTTHEQHASIHVLGQDKISECEIVEIQLLGYSLLRVLDEYDFRKLSKHANKLEVEDETKIVFVENKEKFGKKL